MITDITKLKKIEQEIVDKYRSNVLENYNHWFSIFNIHKSLCLTVDSHIMANYETKPEPGKSIYCFKANVINNTNKLRYYKNSKVYGRLTSLKELRDLGFCNLVIFFDGVKINDDTRCILTNDMILIEYEEKLQFNTTIISFHERFLTFYGNEIEELKYVPGVNKSNCLYITNGKVNDNLFEDVNENSLAIFCYFIEIQDITNKTQLITYDNKVGSVGSNVLLFNDNILDQSKINNIRFNHVTSNILKASTEVSGKLMLFKNRITTNRLLDTLYMRRYIEKFDIRNEMILNSLPNSLKNYKCLHITKDSTLEDLVNQDKDYYEEFLDRITTRSFIFYYDNLPEEFKDVPNTYRFAEVDTAYSKFYKNFFMFSFPSVGEFNLFYNGKLVLNHGAQYHVTNKITYCYLSKEIFPDYKTAIIEVQVTDNYPEYVRYKKELYMDDDCLFGLQDYPGIQQDSDLKKIRIYHNGMLTDIEDYWLFKKRNTLKHNYLAYRNKLYKGDMIFVEYYNEPIKWILNESRLDNNIIELNNIKYPLCIKYYDFYVNGVKRYDLVRITNNKVVFRNSKDLINVKVALKPEYYFSSLPYNFNIYEDAYDYWANIVKDKNDNDLFYRKKINDYDMNNLIFKDKNTDTQIKYHIVYKLFIQYFTVRAGEAMVEEEMIEGMKDLFYPNPLNPTNGTSTLILNAELLQLGDFHIANKERKYFDGILPSILRKTTHATVDASVFMSNLDTNKHNTAWEDNDYHTKLLGGYDVILMDASFEYTHNDFNEYPDTRMIIPNDLILGIDYMQYDIDRITDGEEVNNKDVSTDRPMILTPSNIPETDIDTNILLPGTMPDINNP